MKKLKQPINCKTNVGSLIAGMVFEANDGSIYLTSDREFIADNLHFVSCVNIMSGELKNFSTMTDITTRGDIHFVSTKVTEVKRRA